MCPQYDVMTLFAQVQTLDDFEDGRNLPTLLTSTLDDNLTVIVETVDNQTQVVIGSFGTDVKIVTPPAYACNVSYYAVWISMLKAAV